MIDVSNLDSRGKYCSVEFRNLKKNSSFTEVIYVENTYHKGINDFLSTRYDYLMTFLKSHKFSGDFQYIPRIVASYNKEIMSYYAPYLRKDEIHLSNAGTELLLSHLVDKEDAKILESGLLFHRSTFANDNAIWDYYPFFVSEGENVAWEQIILNLTQQRYDDEKDIHQYSDEVRNGVFCSNNIKDENYADNLFSAYDQKITDLIYKLQKDVLELKQYGLSDTIIEDIVHSENKISEMIITDDNHIYLPDFNNLEIKMEPLTKAVYYLFLRHPEGIIFKYLPDYREELQEIYSMLKPLALPFQVKFSVEKVTNPCCNSINEKCARIKSAFECKFCTVLSTPYIITGNKGEVKKITLPRTMVKWNVNGKDMKKISKK